MDTPEITFTIKDHDAIQSTAQAMEELKRMFIEWKKDMEQKITDMQRQIDKNTKDGEVFHDFIISARSERRSWSIVGGIISGLVVTILEALILHLAGKI